LWKIYAFEKFAPGHVYTFSIVYLL